MRRMSGIWPPSNPTRIELPERAVWPLPPRPLVLPWPLASPWPRRLRRCLAPGRGFRSCKRIKSKGVRGRWRYGRNRKWRRGQRGGSRRRRWGRRYGRQNGSLFGFLYFQTAAQINLFAQPELLKGREGGLDDVGRVFGAERFAQHIPDAGGFQNGPHGFARDDACAGGGWTQQDMRAAISGLDFMRNGVVLQCDPGHLGLGHFPALANGVGHLSGFAQTNANPPLLVTHHDQGAEAKAAATFDHLGRSIDKNNFLGDVGDPFAPSGDEFRAAFRRAAVTPRTAAEPPASAASRFTATFDWFCHYFLLVKLKLQAGFTGGVRQSFYLAVIPRAVAVENNLLYSFAPGGFRGRGPDSFRAGDVGGQLVPVRNRLRHRGSRGESD